MKRIKIMTVCGFGIGSSLILKMNLDDVLAKNNIDVEVFASDVTSVSDNMADVIFTSSEMAEQIKEKVKCEVIEIKNFMDKKEIEEKGIERVRELINA